jgi:hypothetical protein
MTTPKQLVQRAAEHVEHLYRSHPTATSTLLYHDFDHTERVVSRADEIAVGMGMGERERQVLAVAAWFHDTGHLNGDLPGHEDRSVMILAEFLRSEQFDDDGFVKDVERCIGATRFLQQPSDLMEQVISDADTYHFGTREFRDTNKRVKEELRLRGHADQTENWAERTLRILERQQFYTPYCIELLTEGKQANIERWSRKVAEREGETTTKNRVAEMQARDRIEAVPVHIKGDNEEKKSKKEKGKKGSKVALDPEEEARIKDEKAEQKRKDGLVARGVQTALRLASENHMKLSDMADGKANILISVNSIIIGVILSVLLRRLEVDTHLTIPTMIFLTSSVATIVIAILATLPKLTQGRFSREDIVQKKTNLLFFGNFHHSSLQDYQWAMNRLLQDSDYMYGSIVRDIYFLGVVLGRKYRLIRLAYYVFMIGIIASVVAFTVAVQMNAPTESQRVMAPNSAPL